MIDIRELPAPMAPGVPRDGHDRPMVVPEGGGKPTPHTRTTTFIDCIEDKSNLATWGKRCVLIGAAKQPSILQAVVDLDPDDPEGKKQLNALAERCVELSGANEKRDKGTHLHELSELVDAGLVLPGDISSLDLRDMAAYKLATIDFNVQHAERLVVCNELSVAGTPDRTSIYTGPGPKVTISFEKELLITDLKTGTVEYGPLKMGAQLATYSHGRFYDFKRFPAPDRVRDPKAWAAWKKTVFSAEEAAEAYSSIGDVNQEWGVIMNLRPGSGECELYWVDLKKGWAAAKLALEIRKMRSTRNVLVPFQGNAYSSQLAS